MSVYDDAGRAGAANLSHDIVPVGGHSARYWCNVHKVYADTETPAYYPTTPYDRLRAAVTRAELTLATDDPTILELIAAAREVVR